MKAFVDSKVRSVTATGIEPQGVKSSDFNEWQELSDDNLMLKITTRNGQSVNKVYYRFDKQSRLISTTDSSGYVQNTSRFTYDTNGRISIVENTIKDSANDFNQVEIHRWTFDPDGKPISMWRTINNSDSMEIRYVADEEGNPGEEHSYKRGVETGVLYYYFDDKNRLTDIVRFNKKANRLLPDYMFEYDENDRVIQKITTLSNIDLGYIIWRYLFDEKGLKTKEALFDKNKQQTGRIEYSYTFRD
jgi:YD repeat-containing protein